MARDIINKRILGKTINTDKIPALVRGSQIFIQGIGLFRTKKKKKR